MQNLKVKASTIARLAALAVALVNQGLAVFGQDILPFTENMAYQIVSLAITVIVVAVNAWYNNDITHVAILSGKVFDALNDGKLTEEEIEAVLKDTASVTPEEEAAVKENIIVQLVNKIVANIKSKIHPGG